MIASGFGAIFALAFVCLILIGLGVTSLWRPRLALLGFVALMAWLFAPVAWLHVTFAWSNWLSPYDHTRYLSEGRSSEPDRMLGYGVHIPNDAPFRRCNTGWHNDPRQCLWFEISSDMTTRPITFRIVSLGDMDWPSNALLNDRSLCDATPTAYGLLYVPPGSCNVERYNISHVHLTPESAAVQAIFTKDKWSDPTEMGNIRFQHGPYYISATANGLTMDQWEEPISRIIPVIDAYFTVLPPPDSDP